MYMLTGKSKINTIFQYLKYLLSYPEKFVIFYYHKIVVQGLEKLLINEYKFNEKDPLFVKIDGSSTTQCRKNAVKKFQTPLTNKQKQTGKGGTRIILLSITAASSGLTLTASSTVIFAELYWNPFTLIQAEDRVHTISQNNIVNIIYVIGKDTIDEMIFSKVKKKFNIVSKSIDGVNAQNFDANVCNNFTDSLTLQRNLGNKEKEKKKLSNSELKDFDDMLHQFQELNLNVPSKPKVEKKTIYDKYNLDESQDNIQEENIEENITDENSIEYNLVKSLIKCTVDRIEIKKNQKRKNITDENSIEYNQVKSLIKCTVDRIEKKINLKRNRYNEPLEDDRTLKRLSENEPWNEQTTNE